MSASMKERESRMKDLKVLTPIYPHIPSLEELNILDEVREHFVANGFRFVFMANPPCVYEALVREFIYSFVPTWVEHEAPRCRTYVGEWKFRLNGERYRYSRRDLLRLFNVPNEDSFPIVDRDTRNNFWRMISGTNADYVSKQAASKITSPIWKFVHRFIATCVHLRKDEGRWVSKTDLDLMCCFHTQQSVDAISFLTDALEEATIPSFRGTYIGGGHLVTLLAEDLGLTLDPEYAYPLCFLKEEEMVRRKFIKVIRFDNGAVQTYLIGRDPIPNEPHPPPPTDRPGPSSSAPHEPHGPITMESLATEL